MSVCIDKEEVVLSSSQVEEGIVLYENGIEKPVEATQPDNIAEIKKPEYVYRLQCFSEPRWHGLYPKDFGSRTNLMEHVARGRKGATSRFISCRKTLNDLQMLGEHYKSICKRSGGSTYRYYKTEKLSRRYCNKSY